MAENIGRSTGTNSRYKIDAGNVPVVNTPFIGIVKNNTDPTRSGKLMVYIEYLSGPDESNSESWIPVSYVSPFFGTTGREAPMDPESDSGNFVKNKHSYGIWFTPPDLETRVMCFFPNGDPSQGYYLGSIVNEDSHQMVPAIGSTPNYVKDSSSTSGYFSQSSRLPTIELNDYNPALSENPRFFDSEKPIHQVQAFVLLQQGLINDPVRGTIGSSSYRESPSRVFGISTPGRPIYQGGYTDANLQTLLQQDSVSLEQMNIVGRQGGHTIVLDDGDISGDDQLLRFRTSKGHQILLSDSGDTIYISHANGQSWIELGAEGTVDMYAANSVNIRTGDFNLHADGKININGSAINAIAKNSLNLESKQLQITGENSLLMYSEKFVGCKSDGTLSLESDKTGTWEGGSNMILSAGCINLNGGKAPSVPKTIKTPKQKLPDTYWEENIGWQVDPTAIESTVTRAPTHEPWPLHNSGVNKVTSYTAQTDVPLTTEATTKIASIQDVEFVALSESDYNLQPAVDVEVGSLKPEHIKGMLAQANVSVNQNFNEISNNLGVGKYGFSAEQLEESGYLKPGTVEFYLKGGEAELQTVLQSSSVWSGKNGVSNLSGILSDQKLQDFVQTDLYTKSFNDLRSAGVVTGLETPDNLAALVQPASKAGAASVQEWIKDAPTLPVEIKQELDRLSRGSQYSVQLSEIKISENNKGFNQQNQPTTSTVRRQAIDSSAKTVITTEKTTAPSYTRTRTATGTKDPDFQAKRNAVLEKIEIINKQINQEREQFFINNPNSTPGDWITSNVYKNLKNQKLSLASELNNIR